MRELRNDGGRVLDRVAGGEILTVTRAGKPVAELRPLPSRRLKAAALLANWRRLPHVDPDALRADLDEVVDPSL